MLKIVLVFAALTAAFAAFPLLPCPISHSQLSIEDVIRYFECWLYFSESLQCLHFISDFALSTAIPSSGLSRVQYRACCADVWQKTGSNSTLHLLQSAQVSLLLSELHTFGWHLNSSW